jgi:D-tyrosyl-tRNA(Tyr) deacylase
VLVGVGQDDTEEDAYTLAEKLSKMRIMADKEDKMNLSIKDVNGSILAVSQFTLFADTKKGNRPSFIKAAQPKKAREIYDRFVEILKEFGINTETGRFGEYMDIDVELDGPVTIFLDSKK